MSERRKVRFPSANTHCAAWHYPGTNGVCVVMAPGIAVTKEAGTDLLAARFAEAGFTVLAFEYRYLGESGGQPRQIVNIGEQLDDWQAALDCARKLPEVDPRRIAIWGFSLSGGHVLSVAARNPDLGAAIAHAAIVDGIHASRYVSRFYSPAAFLKLNLLAGRDAIGSLLGRSPILIPLYGKRGEVASITTPDSENGPRALNPNGKYDRSWKPVVAARSAVRIGFYRPGRHADKIKIPLLVLEFQEDGVTPPGPAASAAKQAPQGELVQLPGGHYAALMQQHEPAMAAMLDFLQRHLLKQASASIRSRPRLVAAA